MSKLITLYDYPKSSAAYRVRIALNLKGIEFQSVKVDLLAKDQASDFYLATNPQGLVPSLVVGNQLRGLNLVTTTQKRWPGITTGLC